MYNLIESFFQEAKKLWTQRKNWVLSRDFYQMWENIVQPAPFYADEQEIQLLGKTFTLPETNGRKVAFYRWDGSRQSPSLRIEATDWVAAFHFDFDINGNPVVDDPIFDYPEDGELSHGERLEIIYDVLSHLHKKSKVQRQDLLKLDREQYIDALNAIQKYFEDKTIYTMRQLSMHVVTKLIAEALDDSSFKSPNNEAILREKALKKKKEMGMVNIDFDSAQESDESLFPIPSQTLFQITSQLKCLAEARHRVTKYEKVCKIPFTNVKLMEEGDNRGEYAICFNVRPDLPLVEADVITVYDCTGEQEGTLCVDIYDGYRIFGRIRFDDRSGPNKIDDTLWALPVPSSAAYLADAMEHLALAVSQGGTKISPATRAILGLDDVFQYRSKPENSPAMLDIDQCQAWSESCDSRNRVVLVQGPPGTGKTAVLSAVLRTLVQKGMRLLIAAPSNAAVDNLIRRVVDLPVLRIARQRDYVAPDIVQKFWEGELDNVRIFADRMKKHNGGCIFAGTQVSLMKSNIVSDEITARGLFDAVIFDEAGMTRIEELILCTDMAKRAVLFGDHRQLLPFPLPADLMSALKRDWGGMPRILSAMLERSALEWLCDGRGFPTILLKNSYRCQNPRLIRFSSTLFYNAAVRTSSSAEYYRLPEHERQKLYSPATLSLYNTSFLPPEWRYERIVYEGQKPGIENQLEAELSAKIVEDLAGRYPLAQITVIVPYRRQVRLIRHCLNKRKEKSILLSRVGKGEWDIFLAMRISTVDSFQGGESDAVVINYVRSNSEGGVGFVDEPNRINVAHTRCRRELVVIGDLESLKNGSAGRIFHRMERAFARDGIIVKVSKDFLSRSGIYVRAQRVSTQAHDKNESENQKSTQPQTRKSRRLQRPLDDDVLIPVCDNASMQNRLSAQKNSKIRESNIPRLKENYTLVSAPEESKSTHSNIFSSAWKSKQNTHKNPKSFDSIPSLPEESTKPNE